MAASARVYRGVCQTAIRSRVAGLRLFRPEARAKLGVEEDGLYLFRGILPPRLPVRTQALGCS